MIDSHPLQCFAHYMLKVKRSSLKQKTNSCYP